MGLQIPLDVGLRVLVFDPRWWMDRSLECFLPIHIVVLRYSVLLFDLLELITALSAVPPRSPERTPEAPSESMYNQDHRKPWFLA